MLQPGPANDPLVHPRSLPVAGGVGHLPPGQQARPLAEGAGLGRSSLAWGGRHYPGEVVIFLREGWRSYPYDGVLAEAEQSQVLAAKWPGSTEEVGCQKEVSQVSIQIGSQPGGGVGSCQENNSLEMGVEFVSGKGCND